MAPGYRVPGSQVPGSGVPGSRVNGTRVPGYRVPWSQVTGFHGPKVTGFQVTGFQVPGFQGWGSLLAAPVVLLLAQQTPVYALVIPGVVRVFTAVARPLLTGYTWPGSVSESVPEHTPMSCRGRTRVSSSPWAHFRLHPRTDSWLMSGTGSTLAWLAR